MASVQTSSYGGRYLKLSVWEESTNIANNTSTVKWKLESIGGEVNYYTIYKWGVWVYGQEKYGTQTTNWDSYNFPAAKGSREGTVTVTHNNDGTASDVGFTLKGSVYYNRDNTYNGSCSLSTIPRQANITSAPNFNDEQNPTINYNNSAGNSVSSLQACISLTGATDDIAYRDISKTGTSYTFNLTTAERNVLRNACTTSNSRNVIFFIRTVIGGNTFYSTVTKTLTITNANPTFNASDITYQDTNSNIVAITQNNQHIVRNNSNLEVTFASATALKGASITKYEITFNGATQQKTSASTINYGTVNLSSNASVSIKVTDSRGNTTTRSKTITILDWVLPSAVIYHKRTNNYEDETKIKAKCTISSVNNKNAIQELKFRYKKTINSTWSSYTNLTDDTLYTLSIDKNYAWDFQIVVKDKFGTTTYNFIVAKGVAILYIDTLNQSVGINCFPEQAETLAINGYDFKKLYPVGYILMTTTNVNPSTYIYGTWSLLASGQLISGSSATIYAWTRTG